MACFSYINTKGLRVTTCIAEGEGPLTFIPNPDLPGIVDLVQLLGNVLRGELQISPRDMLLDAAGYRKRITRMRRSITALSAQGPDYTGAADVVGSFKLRGLSVRIGDAHDVQPTAPKTAAELGAFLRTLTQTVVFLDTIATALEGAVRVATLGEAPAKKVSAKKVSAKKAAT